MLKLYGITSAASLTSKTKSSVLLMAFAAHPAAGATAGAGGGSVNRSDGGAVGDVQRRQVGIRASGVGERRARAGVQRAVVRGVSSGADGRRREREAGDAVRDDDERRVR